jgi:hypothetical protein
MKNKIRLYESEIKRSIRRKLMERYIDEVEKMDVYKKDEIDLSTVKSGTYGLKDEKGNIKSITVNEEDGDDMDVTDPDVLQTFATDGTFLGMKYSPVRDMDVDDDYKDRSLYDSYYGEDEEEEWNKSHIKENISKVISRNLSKKFKRSLK